MLWQDIIHYYEIKIQKINEKKDPRSKYVTASYKKFIDIIKNAQLDEKKITENDIELLKVSDHMKGQIKIIMQNPDMIEKSYTPNIKEQLISLLGIGEIKANELISAGIKNINQLKLKKFKSMLSDTTQKILEFEPERKILRENIAKVEPAILSLCDNKDGCINSIILGSYRRRAASSRDIDIMIVSNDLKILDKFLERANLTFGKENIIPYANGPDKLSILVKFNNIASFKNNNLGVYKLDIFRAPPDKAHAMQLYATGSKEFNIIMRTNAKLKGYLLNQDGLYNRKTNKLIPTFSERGIFEKIEMPYKEPWER
jgi:DNA polymerase/3'-5' exonuclease PolX